MGKLYIRLLGIDKNSEEAKKLMGSASSGSSNTKSIDYADVVYSVIKNRFPNQSKITVYEVNYHLKEISDHYHSGNSKKVQCEFNTAVFSIFYFIVTKTMFYHFSN